MSYNTGIEGDMVLEGDCTIIGNYEMTGNMRMSGSMYLESGSMQMRAEGGGSGPSAPAAGEGGHIYVKTDDKLYYVSNSISEVELSTHSGGGGSARSVSGDVDDGIITWKTSDNTFINEGANLKYDGAALTVAGQVSASLGLTGSAAFIALEATGGGHVLDATHFSSSLNISGSKFYGDGSALSGIIDDAHVLDATHFSSSLNISGSKFYGDGSALSGISSDGRSVAGDTDNGVITWKTSDNTFITEANLTFDGTDVTLSSAGKINFRDTNSFINSGEANDLQIAATDITLDAAADIILDAAGSDVLFKVGGTLVGGLSNSSSDLVLSSSVSDKDILFKGSDAGSAVTALTLDMSEGGSALFSNDVSLNTDSSVFNMGDDDDFTITHDGTSGATIAAAPITVSSTGDMTLDSSADIILDAGGADVLFKDDGVLIGGLTNSSTDLVLSSSVSDKDIKFIGSDAGVAVTALYLDMSDGGKAHQQVGAVWHNAANPSDYAFISVGANGATAIGTADADGVSDGLAIIPGSGKVAINSTTANTALDVHYTGSGNPINMGATAGGDIIYFGTGSTTAGGLYFLNTDGGWEPTNANGVGSKGYSAGHGAIGGNASMLGFAGGTNPLIHGMLMRGWIHLAAVYGGFSAGSVLYVHSGSAAQAGTVTTSAPSSSAAYVRAVGYCTSQSNVIYFNPDKTWVELS